jgi:hypothetical protein
MTPLDRLIPLLTEAGLSLLTEAGDVIGIERLREQGRAGGIRPKRPASYGYEVFEEDESVLMMLGVM